MNRYKWEFEYQARIVADAAKKKMEFHRERQAYWHDQFEAAFSAVRGSVSLQETPLVRGRTATTYAAAEMLSNKMTDLEVSFDPHLRSDMENKRAKLGQHKSLADNYQAYYSAISSQPPTHLIKLTIDDVTYFGLGGWTPEEEIDKDE